MKIEYKQEDIMQAIRALNEISVTGLRNAEKLVIVSKLLDRGHTVEGKEEERGEGQDGQLQHS